MTATAPRLLAVHAHPDDETLSTGGLLATWTAAGWPAMVVTATRGELGEVIPAELAHLEGAGEALGRHRTVERAAALAALGVQYEAFLDQTAPPTLITDSGMRWVSPGQAGPGPTAEPTAFSFQDFAEMAERLAQLMEEFQPDVVATYEPGGGYGHPDHIRTHEVTMAAIDIVTQRTGRAITVLWAVIPQAELAKAWAGLAASAHIARLLETNPELHLPAFLPDDAATAWPAMSRPGITPQQLLKVDVRPVAAALAAALRAYPTQAQGVTELDDANGVNLACAMSHGELIPIGPAEYYELAKFGGAQPVHPALTWPTENAATSSQNQQPAQVD